MEWLSPQLANQLQFVTLPLELIGLLLATIEVRFPTLTRHLNTRLLAIDRAVERSDAKWRRDFPRVAAVIANHRFHLPTPGWLQWTILALIVVALTSAFFILLLDLAPWGEEAREVAGAWLERFLWRVYTPIILAAGLSMAAIRFVVRFAEDRAVGTLGILIAGLGVSGEVYQFAVAVAGLN